MNWEIWDAGAASAEQNMTDDVRLLKEMVFNPRPVLHFYDWSGKAATYGYFAKPETLLNLDSFAAKEIQLAKRPTGGGVLFHFTDLAFSVAIPESHRFYTSNTLQNYAHINGIVEKAIRKFAGSPCNLLGEELLAQECAGRFCMGKPTRYDVMLGGKKAAGAAQRRTKNGILHQGTIHLTYPDWNLLADLLKDQEAVDAMRFYSASFVEPKELVQAKQEMKQHLIDLFTEH